jgi:hypothetical protein
MVLSCMVTYSCLRPSRVTMKALTVLVCMLFAGTGCVQGQRMRHSNDQAARQLAESWFHYLLQNEPEKAFQLHQPQSQRQPLDDRLCDFYRNDAAERENLEGFVKTELVRKLLALGPKAMVRYHETVEQAQLKKYDMAIQLYAVTFEEQGERKSFFVKMAMVCEVQPAVEPSWRVVYASLRRSPG